MNTEMLKGIPFNGGTPLRSYKNKSDRLRQKMEELELPAAAFLMQYDSFAQALQIEFSTMMVAELNMFDITYATTSEAAQFAILDFQDALAAKGYAFHILKVNSPTVENSTTITITLTNIAPPFARLLAPGAPKKPAKRPADYVDDEDLGSDYDPIPGPPPKVPRIDSDSKRASAPPPPEPQKMFDFDDIKFRMWNKSKTCNFSTQTTCGKCGSSNSAWCACEFAKWTPTEEQMKEWAIRNNVFRLAPGWCGTK